MGIRLLILLVVGLGALYSIHLLAQDFFKLTNKVQSAASTVFGKRDVENIEEIRRNLTDAKLDFEKKIDWDNILKRDPFNCALSLICQLSAGAAKHNEEAERIYEFITDTIEHSSVPKKLKKAYDQGSEYNKNTKSDYKKCYKNYPICPYSAETMMRLISHFTTLQNLLFG